jgi:hypothetical protein
MGYNWLFSPHFHRHGSRKQPQPPFREVGERGGKLPLCVAIGVLESHSLAWGGITWSSPLGYIVLETIIQCYDLLPLLTTPCHFSCGDLSPILLDAPILHMQKQKNMC